MTKIAIIIDKLQPGGVQISAIEYVRNLNKLNHQAKLFILMREEIDQSPPLLTSDVPFSYLSDSYPKPFRKSIKFPFFNFFSTNHLWSILFAPRQFSKDKFDIIIGMGASTCLTVASISKLKKIPYIAIIHDPITFILKKCYYDTPLRFAFPILLPLGEFLEKIIVKSATKTILISKVHFNYFVSNFKIHPLILPLSTDFPKRLSSRKKERILSFGRWDNQKKPEFLIELAKSLPKIPITIAGSWTNPKELADFKLKIVQSKLTDQIQVTQSYTKTKLARLCRQALVWVYPSFESFSLSALEATSFGLPIIIPAKSGITEYFEHGIHGFFPKGLDLNEYKKYILKLLRDRSLAERMGNLAYKTAKSKFSSLANTKDLLTSVNTILNKDNPRIFVLETAHTKEATPAGGDLLMRPMAEKLKEKFKFTIIVPKIANKYWQESPIHKEIISLPRTSLDNSVNPFSIFINYVIRIVKSTKILLNNSKKDTIYSSTDILTDTFPAFITKLIHKDSRWIARVHHLIPPPLNREGNFLVNLISFLLQRISINLIKLQADSILALNDNLRINLDKLGLPKAKLRVLGAGINYHDISSQKVLTNTKSYDGVFLGRLHRTKGVFDLIPIWKEVVKKYPKARLGIIGKSYDSTPLKLKRQIQKSNLQKNIFLLGYLKEKEKISILKKAKVFLFTDHEAGFGIAVAEAMAAGLPVVGWDIGILGNVYKAGYLCSKKGDYQDFGLNITKLLENGQTYKKVSSSARRVASGLDWSKTSNQFLKIAEQI
ncbi:glycosyltransferase [Candidatus Daviesbacteria bacterium]|nr:glycosyltransferase [Candidatus Daviesbacteria bacterium]